VYTRFRPVCPIGPWPMPCLLRTSASTTSSCAARIAAALTGKADTSAVCGNRSMPASRRRCDPLRWPLGFRVSRSLTAAMRTSPPLAVRVARNPCRTAAPVRCGNRLQLLRGHRGDLLTFVIRLADRPRNSGWHGSVGATHFRDLLRSHRQQIKWLFVPSESKNLPPLRLVERPDENASKTQSLVTQCEIPKRLHLPQRACAPPLAHRARGTSGTAGHTSGVLRSRDAREQQRPQ